MEEVELFVGARCITRSGKEVLITHKEENPWYPQHVWCGTLNYSYAVTGHWAADYSENSRDILRVWNPQDNPRLAKVDKQDKGKIKFSLLTRGLAKPLEAIADVFTHGASKYKPEGWKTVQNPIKRYEDALDRHLNKWKQGVIYDAESGKHHLAHAAVNLLFILYFSMARLEQQNKS